MSAKNQRFLEGEWAWISGASSGLGRAIALRLAASGVGVVVSARRSDELSKLADEIGGFGGRSLALPVDVTAPKAISQAVGLIQERIGRLDIVVLSAGSEMMLPFDMVTPEKFRKHWEVNVMGALEMVRCSLRLLQASGRRQGGQGRVVFVSSLAAHRGRPGQVGYGTNKAAILGAMKSLAAELALLRIRVNAVLPGIVATPLQERMFARMPEAKQNELVGAHPFGMGRPEDVAAAVEFLASYDSQWISGIELVVDGGATIV